MNRIWSVIAIALVMLLSACGTTQPVVIHDTVVLAPQDNLLLACPVEPPPSKEEYAKMTPKEKEKALAAAYNKQTLNVGLCNKDKAGLREWKAKELQRVNSKNAVKGKTE